MVEKSTISLRAYAKRRGVALSAVQRAISERRLVGCLAVVAGKPKIADPDLADREWEARSRPQPTGSSLPAAEADPNSYSEMRRRREEELWRQAQLKRETDELDLAARRGELVSATEARASVVEAFTVVRTKLLAVPTRAKQRMPHLSAHDVATIDDLVREALEELADGVLESGGGA